MGRLEEARTHNNTSPRLKQSDTKVEYAELQHPLSRLYLSSLSLTLSLSLLLTLYIYPPQVKFDKITSRIEKLCYGLNMKYVDPVMITQKVIQGLYPGITTMELDELAAQTAAYNSTHHPDFSLLAARISISNMHKETNPSFSANIETMRNNVHPSTGIASPLISEPVHQIVMNNAAALDEYIDHKRDFAYDYFGYKTLERSYLFRINGKIVERPQHMIMRVAIGIHNDNLERVFETYDLMSQR